MRTKELRRKANLTQMELSQLLGMTRVTVANWELGRRHPPAKSLPLIAKHLIALLMSFTAKVKIN